MTRLIDMAAVVERWFRPCHERLHECLVAEVDLEVAVFEGELEHPTRL